MESLYQWAEKEDWHKGAGKTTPVKKRGSKPDSVFAKKNLWRE
jgi:hypothetical protein